jgi:hypothetical protein
MSRADNLFDALRTRFKLKNDARLAERLDVAPAVICKTRQRGTASDGLLIKIHETFEMPFTEIRQLAEQSAPQQ